MSSLAPKTYMMALTAEQIEQRLLSIDNMLSKDVIRQSLSSPDAATVPSTKAVADALTPITQTLDGLGDLASKDSVALDSNETGGVLPISKGGSGGSNLSEAQQNLGILSETQIQQLINESIPTIQQIWLDSPQVNGVLPIAKGGTGSSSPAQALKNLGIHDSSGKVPVSQLPAITITDTFPVASEAAMLSLDAQKGDIALRTDVSKTFILVNEPATVLSNWLELINDVEQRLGIIRQLVRTATDIPATAGIGSFVETLGKYSPGKGAGQYVITAGTTPFPLVDPQIAADRYAKLLPLKGTNYNYSLLAAGGKNDLSIDSSTSIALNQLLAKIYAESPVIGGLVLAEGGQYYLTDPVTRPAVGAKHLGVIGEYSNLSYGTYESKTIFYFDNSLSGPFAFDFFESRFMTFTDFSLRGDVNTLTTKGGLRLGKAGTPQASGYSDHLVERIQVSNCTDCILFQNSGISTIRDIQVTHYLNRGLALVTSGDTNVYNVYANDGNKDTTDTSLTVGVGIYVGAGSNNVNVFGGKLEFNSKGFVCHGSNGVNTIGVQFDYNKMANHIIKSIDDGTQACRGNHSTGCRYLSGGVVAGFQKSGIYLDSTNGSVTLSLTGGGLQAAGDGAYDSSTSGIMGPDIGIYAKGNATYTLEVTGSGIILENPGLTYAAVVDGLGSKIRISGSGGKKPTQELNSGKCHIGFCEERTDAVSLFGDSGSATYSTAICDTVVVDGVATMDITIAVTSVVSLTGNITIGELPYVNTGSQQASVTFGMISSVSNTPTGMLGYVDPGSKRIILWKRATNGDPSRLTGADISNASLLKMSVRMKVV